MSIAVIVFILLIILISLGFGGMAIKWDHDFKLKREELRTESRGSSLGTSELRGLIQEAMLETISPLEERLDLIEMHMRQLPAHATESEARDGSESDDSRGD